jgi:sec-independent protein translocase protein TatA
MFGMGATELLIIAVIILIIFGARKIPEIGKGLGGAVREFRNIKKEITRSPSKEASSSKKEEEKAPDLLEEGIKKQVLNHVPGVRKAMDISDKVKKVNELIK